jgi:hypothetical protein
MNKEEGPLEPLNEMMAQRLARSEAARERLAAEARRERVDAPNPPGETDGAPRGERLGARRYDVKRDRDLRTEDQSNGGVPMLEVWVAIQRLIFTVIAVGSVVIVVGDAAVALRGSWR